MQNQAKNLKIKSDNFTGNKRGKFNIAIAILEKLQLYSTKIILHFGCTNNIIK